MVIATSRWRYDNIWTQDLLLGREFLLRRGPTFRGTVFLQHLRPPGRRQWPNFVTGLLTVTRLQIGTNKGKLRCSYCWPCLLLHINMHGSYAVLLQILEGVSMIPGWVEFYMSPDWFLRLWVARRHLLNLVKLSELRILSWEAVDIFKTLGNCMHSAALLGSCCLSCGYFYLSCDINFWFLVLHGDSHWSWGCKMDVENMGRFQDLVWVLVHWHCHQWECFRLCSCMPSIRRTFLCLIISCKWFILGLVRLLVHLWSYICSVFLARCASFEEVPWP